VSAADRLSAHASLALERKLRRQAEAKQAEVREFTFAPKVNEHSKRLLAQMGGGAKGSGVSDFVERQQAWLEAKRTQDVVRAHQSAAMEGPFKPAIGNASRIIAEVGLDLT
jgi:hypothetical protein